MRKTIFLLCFVFFSLAFTSRALAQDESKPQETAKTTEAPAHYYHLEFVVQELGTDGKPTNSRTYTTTVTTSTDSRDYTSIRVGSRIPIATGSSSTSSNPNALVNTQFQYVDVGVNIDIHRAHEVGRLLSFALNADISSVAETRDANLHQPIIRQNKWQAVVLIPIGKPSVVCTSDTLDSKGSIQLVVTATPVQ